MNDTRESCTIINRPDKQRKKNTQKKTSLMVKTRQRAKFILSNF